VEVITVAKKNKVKNQQTQLDAEFAEEVGAQNQAQQQGKAAKRNRQ